MPSPTLGLAAGAPAFDLRIEVVKIGLALVRDPDKERAVALVLFSDIVLTAGSSGCSADATEEKADLASVTVCLPA